MDWGQIPPALPYIGGGLIQSYSSSFIPGKIGTAARIGGILAMVYGVVKILDTMTKTSPEITVEPGLPGGVPPGEARVGARIIAPPEGGKSGLNSFYTVFLGKTTRSYPAKYEIFNRGDKEVTVVADFVVKEFPIGGPKGGTEVRVPKTVTIPAGGSQVVTINEVPVGSSVLFDVPAVAQVFARASASEGMAPISTPRSYTIRP